MHAYSTTIAEEVEKKLVECFSSNLLVLARHKVDVLGTIYKHKHKNGCIGNIRDQYLE